MTDPRPDWNLFFLNGARWVASRGDCTRRQVGAMIIDPDTHDVIEPGYNGPPAGEPGCLSAGACPRGRHFHRSPAFCACGGLWPCKDAVEPGSSYDTGPGRCIAIHAEANALLRAGRRSRGAWMYLTEKPCDGCMKLIKGAGIVRVIWPEGNLEL
jgi:dCMP deaminase